MNPTPLPSFPPVVEWLLTPGGTYALGTASMKDGLLIVGICAVIADIRWWIEGIRMHRELIGHRDRR